GMPDIHASRFGDRLMWVCVTASWPAESLPAGSDLFRAPRSLVSMPIILQRSSKKIYKSESGFSLASFILFKSHLFSADQLSKINLECRATRQEGLLKPGSPAFD